MFKVNDYVVYGSTGVCQITDIRTEEFIKGDEAEYYILQPAYNNNMTIKIPVNNPKVSMRKVIKKDDVPLLIAMMPDKETLWIDDDKLRRNNFLAALKTGKSEEWIKIYKTIYNEKKARLEIGKKLAKTDEDIMNAAEKQLYEEVAIALEITPDEVAPYILEHIS